MRTYSRLRSESRVEDRAIEKYKRFYSTRIERSERVLTDLKTKWDATGLKKLNTIKLKNPFNMLNPFNPRATFF